MTVTDADYLAAITDPTSRETAIEAVAAAAIALDREQIGRFEFHAIVSRHRELLADLTTDHIDSWLRPDEQVDYSYEVNRGFWDNTQEHAAQHIADQLASGTGRAA